MPVDYELLPCSLCTGDHRFSRMSLSKNCMMKWCWNETWWITCNYNLRQGSAKAYKFLERSSHNKSSPLWVHSWHVNHLKDESEEVRGFISVCNTEFELLGSNLTSIDRRIFILLDSITLCKNQFRSSDNNTCTIVHTCVLSLVLFVSTRSAVRTISLAWM